MSAEYMLKNAKKLKKQVYGVSLKIDNEIERLKLNAMGIKIDKLTPEQKNTSHRGRWAPKGCPGLGEPGAQV